LPADWAPFMEANEGDGSRTYLLSGKNEETIQSILPMASWAGESHIWIPARIHFALARAYLATPERMRRIVFDTVPAAGGS
jgi:hypothetical protein